MLKLKIGDNYLITTKQDRHMREFIVYTMGCFKMQNKVLLGLDVLNSPSFDFLEYKKAVKEEKPRELYLLVDVPNSKDSGEVSYFKQAIRSFVMELSAVVPQTKFYIVKINNKKDSREYKLADKIYDTLVLDNKSILNHLDSLDEYKHFASRYKAIPAELKAINEEIKKMSKEVKICDRIITLKDLEYLDMIEGARLEGNSLILDIKPLNIFPSEPLGKCISKSSFKDNPYLARAAEYLYKGCNFGMVGTRIRVNPNFRPEFIETHDHQFDDMFLVNNWSSIGYLHFGQGHLCGGEFNDVMAHTGEHGLEYYFICLKQYITTANVRDYAGLKVWWYPIFDKEGNFVYCAGLDVLRDAVLSQMNMRPDERERVKNMSMSEFQKWRFEHNISFRNVSLPDRYRSSNVSTHSSKDDHFLLYCKENNPELYKELTEGAK